ncbi:MAG: hypothetical protein PHQ27_00410 [Victivallales bacterium]|nr:hypothetical protein [Victivallales bacterium]
MNRGKVLILGWLILLIGAAGSLRAVECGGVAVKLLPAIGDSTDYGYQEAVFLVQNMTDQPHRVTIAIESTQGFGNNIRLSSVKKSLMLPPRADVRAKLFKLPVGMLLPRLSLFVDGKRYDSSDWGEKFSHIFNNGDGSYLSFPLVYLVSQGVVPGKPGTVFSASRSFSGRSPSRSSSYDPKEIFYFIWSFLPVEQWSDSWLAYTGYLGVILSREEWERLPAGARDALTRYAAGGGTLVLVGTPPADVAAGGKPHKMAKRVLDFGMMIYSAKNPAQYDKAEWRQLQELSSSNMQQWKSSITPQTLFRELPLIKDDRLPFRPLFFMMLLFVLIIGPGNIFWLRRRKRMIWLLWTTPVIAILFSMAVVVYSLVAEGWHSRVRNNSLTILDENRQQAATIGIHGYYCPLPPGSGVKYSETTAVYPLQTSVESHSGAVDWSNGQLLSSDWIMSRIPTYFLVRRIEPRRERLQILARTPVQMTVLNGIGTTLTNLHVAGPDGRVYRATGPILSGEKAVLEFITPDMTARPETFDPRSQLGNITGYLASFNPANVQLRPGTYCARMAATPFLPPGIKPGELRDESCLYGILSVSGGKK